MDDISSYKMDDISSYKMDDISSYKMDVIPRLRYLELKVQTGNTLGSGPPNDLAFYKFYVFDFTVRRYC